MTPIMPMLKRDWIEFRKHTIFTILFWALMPILIHTFISIPLSRLIFMDIRYLNWSAAGVWITTAGMIAFLESANRLRKIHFETRQIDAILQSPVTNLELLSVIMLRGVIFGLCQFGFALCITSTLNHEYFGITNILFITIQMLVIILFFSALGTIFGLMISNTMIFIQSSFILFLLLSLGMGTFIPMSYYPDRFTSILSNIPLTIVFENVQAIITHDPIQWVSFFLTIGLIFIIVIVTLIISHNIFRKI